MGQIRRRLTTKPLLTTHLWRCSLSNPSQAPSRTKGSRGVAAHASRGASAAREMRCEQRVKKGGAHGERGGYVANLILAIGPLISSAQPGLIFFGVFLLLPSRHPSHSRR